MILVMFSNVSFLVAKSYLRQTPTPPLMAPDLRGARESAHDTGAPHVAFIPDFAVAHFWLLISKKISCQAVAWVKDKYRIICLQRCIPNNISVK